MSRLSPSFSWAARQPGEATCSGPLVGWPPGVTRTAHPAILAYCQAGVHLIFSWEVGRDPCFTGGPVLVCISCFWKASE